MKLRNEETLLEEGLGFKLIRRSYLPATHTYDYKFLQTALYCPTCGAQNVWVEDSPGDYYIGPEHRCGSCDAEFHLQ